MKKRYWRLSLLIHPDKCDHPKAHDAFQAVTGAAKELQARAQGLGAVGAGRQGVWLGGWAALPASLRGARPLPLPTCLPAVRCQLSLDRMPAPHPPAGRRASQKGG